MSVLQPGLKNNGPYLPYWFNAILLGSMVTLSLFLVMHKLGSDITLPDPPAIIVDFMQWQEPVKPKPMPAQTKKSKARTVKKTKPRIKKPAIRSKPVMKPVPQPVKPEPDTDKVLTESTSVAEPEVKPPSPPPVEQKIEESLPAPLPVFKATSLPRIAHLADLAGFYPPTKRQQGIEATVKLQVLIDRDGKPRKVSILKSAGAEFDQAAIDAIMASSFIPAKFEGRPGPVLWRFPVTFRLK